MRPSFRGQRHEMQSKGATGYKYGAHIYTAPPSRDVRGGTHMHSIAHRVFAANLQDQNTTHMFCCLFQSSRFPKTLYRHELEGITLGCCCLGATQSHCLFKCVPLVPCATPCVFQLSMGPAMLVSVGGGGPDEALDEKLEAQSAHHCTGAAHHRTAQRYPHFRHGENVSRQ